MSTIFLFALLAPLAYAMCNQIDKILLERYFKEGGVEVLIIFSGLLSAIAAVVCLFIDPNIFGVGWDNIKILVTVGVLDTVLLWAYLRALDMEEPSIVIIFYQMVPVIGLAFSHYWLGETLMFDQKLGMGLVIAGAIVMSFVIDGDGKWRARWKTVLFMTIASTCWAVQSTIFKDAALEVNVPRAFFWEHLSMVVIASLLLFLPMFRDPFLKALRVNSAPIMGTNVFNEVLYQAGNAVAAIVVVVIPVSLTLLVNGFQPLFVILIGLVLYGFASTRVFMWFGYPMTQVKGKWPLGTHYLVIYFGKLFLGMHRAFRSVDIVNRRDLPQLAIAMILIMLGVPLLNFEIY